MPPDFKCFWYFKLPNPENLTINCQDGSEMQGWYFRKPGAVRTAILGHGMGGNMTWYLHLTRVLMDANCSVVMYDQRGFGNSTGVATLEGMFPDGVQAYDFVANNLHIPASKIIFVGQSLGTGVACFVSERRPCAGLILVSPYASLRMRIADLVFFLALFPDSYFSKWGMDNRPVLAAKHPPVLMIAGTDDQSLPLKQAQDLNAAASQPKNLLVVDHATHGDLYDKYAPLCLKSMNTFLEKIPQ